jgi:hypothetical protein
VTKYFAALFVAAAVLVTGTAMAANPPAEPVTLTAKPGNVTFDHKMHAAQKCETCHVGKPAGGKIEFTKDTAHALCMDCHKKQAKGPVKCAECHKRK